LWVEIIAELSQSISEFVPLDGTRPVSIKVAEYILPIAYCMITQCVRSHNVLTSPLYIATGRRILGNLGKVKEISNTEKSYLPISPERSLSNMAIRSLTVSRSNAKGRLMSSICRCTLKVHTGPVSIHKRFLQFRRCRNIIRPQKSPSKCRFWITGYLTRVVLVHSNKPLLMISASG
jgi:hypothetical protein